MKFWNLNFRKNKIWNLHFENLKIVLRRWVVAERCCGYRCCGKVLPPGCGFNSPRPAWPASRWQHTKVLRLQLTQASMTSTFPQQRHPQHLSATTHLRNNHMYGGVNIGAFIKYYIGAFNIQLTEYNHNLWKSVKYLRAPYQILDTSMKTSPTCRSPTFGK